MFGLSHLINPRQQTIEDQVATLAAKEREVRQLEAFIEHISLLDDKELERIWPRLNEALNSRRVKHQRALESGPRTDTGARRISQRLEPQPT